MVVSRVKDINTIKFRHGALVRNADHGFRDEASPIERPLSRMEFGDDAGDLAYFSGAENLDLSISISINLSRTDLRLLNP